MPSALAATVVMMTESATGPARGTTHQPYQIDRRDEQQAGAERVQQQARLERVFSSHRAGNHCRRHEVGPVVVERPPREIGVADRRFGFRQLRGQRHVPQKICGEVGAIAQVARRVALAHAGERSGDQQRDDEQGAEQADRVRSVPGRQVEDCVTAADEEVRGGAHSGPGHRQPGARREAEVGRNPERKSAQRVADDRAGDPSGGMTRPEQVEANRQAGHEQQQVEGHVAQACGAAAEHPRERCHTHAEEQRNRPERHQAFSRRESGGANERKDDDRINARSV